MSLLAVFFILKVSKFVLGLSNFLKINQLYIITWMHGQPKEVSFSETVR